MKTRKEFDNRKSLHRSNCEMKLKWYSDKFINRK